MTIAMVRRLNVLRFTPDKPPGECSSWVGFAGADGRKSRNAATATESTRRNRYIAPIFMAARPGFAQPGSACEVEGGWRNGEGAEIGFELNRIEVTASAAPVLGRELEVPFLGPVREQAHDLVEVELRVNAV